MLDYLYALSNDVVLVATKIVGTLMLIRYIISHEKLNVMHTAKNIYVFFFFFFFFQIGDIKKNTQLLNLDPSLISYEVDVPLPKLEVPSSPQSYLPPVSTMAPPVVIKTAAQILAEQAKSEKTDIHSNTTDNSSIDKNKASTPEKIVPKRKSVFAKKDPLQQLSIKNFISHESPMNGSDNIKSEHLKTKSRTEGESEIQEYETQFHLGSSEVETKSQSIPSHFTSTKGSHTMEPRKRKAEYTSTNDTFQSASSYAKTQQQIKFHNVQQTKPSEPPHSQAKRPKIATSDKNKPLICSKTKAEIAAKVVSCLMPHYRDGKIKSKVVFKFVAKCLSKAILDLNGGLGMNAVLFIEI
jgi:hypothetical protein